MKKYQNDYCENNDNIYNLIIDLKNIMWDYAGILRSEISLRKALSELDNLEKLCGNHEVCASREEYEFKNMLTVSKLVAACALERKESRGAHFREDYPQTLSEEKHSYIRIGEESNVEIFAS